MNEIKQLNNKLQEKVNGFKDAQQLIVNKALLSQGGLPGQNEVKKIVVTQQMIDEAYEELDRRKVISERGSFREKMLQRQDTKEMINQKRGKKVDMSQKKEILKEVLSVMKFAVFWNEKTAETNDYAPYSGYIYLVDEQKNEARLLLDDIPLWKVSSTDLMGFEQLDGIESQIDKKVIKNP